jgi:nucleoside-diphosphate-sugar epimerase
VRDVSRAFLRALEASEWPTGSQRLLNVSAGRVHTSAEAAEIIRRIIPGADIEIGATLTPLEESNARMRAPLDITKSREVLGWSPEWSLEDRLREYAGRFSAYVRAAG